MNTVLVALASLLTVGLWLLSYVRGVKLNNLQARDATSAADAEVVPQQQALDALKSSLQTLEEKRVKDAEAYRSSLTAPPPSDK